MYYEVLPFGLMGLQTFPSFVWTLDVFGIPSPKFFSQLCGCFPPNAIDLCSTKGWGPHAVLQDSLSVPAPFHSCPPTSKWLCVHELRSLCILKSLRLSRFVWVPSSLSWSAKLLPGSKLCGYGGYFLYFLSGSQSCVSLLFNALLFAVRVYFFWQLSMYDRSVSSSVSF